MSNTKKTEILAEKIDWIAYTQKSNISWQFPHYISDKWKKISPLRNYTHGEENQQGVKRYWNIIREDQGRMVVMSGSASAILGDYREEFLQWLHFMDARATRIDYALDIMYSDFNPKSCIQHIRNKTVKTHAQSAIQVTDEFKGGFTQYLGTKTSETYTRIYDKSVEQKTDYSWTRIETVYQSDRAEASLSAYLQYKSVKPLILAHVDFPKWRAWKRVMSGDVAKLHVPLRETRTRAWLLSQVAKSIAREIAMDEDQSFWFELAERVRQEYKTLTKDGQKVDW